jgi:hypothetical protein
LLYGSTQEILSLHHDVDILHDSYGSKLEVRL